MVGHNERQGIQACNPDSRGMTSASRSFTVVAAVIRNERGEVLLTKRPEGRHMAGLWEFPGGKLRAGEAPAQGLERELAEELDIAVEVGERITTASHSEPGLVIRLLFFAAAITGGRPRPQEGQAMAWVRPDDLESFPMPPADADLVRRLAAGGPT